VFFDFKKLVKKNFFISCYCQAILGSKFFAKKNN